MDYVKGIPGSLDSRSDDCLSYVGTTPPGHQAQLPPTPPATEERRGRPQGSTGGTVKRLLREWKRRAEESDSSPLAKFLVDRREYDRKAIERLFSRHDYDTQTGILIVRMPSTVHEYFSSRIVDVLKDQLRNIREGGGESGKFASKIASVGSARVLLEEGDESDDGVSRVLRRQPDAQFQHPDTTYPGVIVEVSYSQDGKNLQKLAQDYILYSGGDIKAVVGIDINPLGKESTVALWRPKFTWLEDEKIDCLEAELKISHMVRCLFIFHLFSELRLTYSSHFDELTGHPRIKVNASLSPSVILPATKCLVAMNQSHYQLSLTCCLFSLQMPKSCSKGGNLEAVSSQDGHLRGSVSHPALPTS